MTFRKKVIQRAKIKKKKKKTTGFCVLTLKGESVFH